MKKKIFYINESQLRMISEMEENEEITFYRFLNEMRSFIKSVLKDPIHVKTPLFFNGMKKTKDDLICDLLKRGVLSKKEKISEKSLNGKKHSFYSVKYDFKSNDFENKIKSLYDSYSLNKINEEGCAGMEGATSANVSAAGSFEAPFGTAQKRSIWKHTFKKNKIK